MLLALCTRAHKSIEKLRYQPPGEWGKLLGLDRVPEVSTLRDKVKFCGIGNPLRWRLTVQGLDGWIPNGCADLLCGWPCPRLPREADQASQSLVSRQRLCMRATVDYWINAMDGQPFFCGSPGRGSGACAGC